MPKKNNIFSNIRLKQILNDIKRRDKDAARELNISEKEFERILNGKKPISLEIINLMTKIWPIKISDLINPQINDSEFIYVKNKISNKSARLMQRNGLDYYEYKDTATERNAPYKPEWIRTLCYVEDNKPNNKIVAWNKGHLLHQFTYFVGDVNFYYIKNGKKIVSIMNSGDSCYIAEV
mgnify:FL=1